MARIGRHHHLNVARTFREQTMLVYRDVLGGTLFILGDDPRHLSEERAALLTHPEILALASEGVVRALEGRGVRTVIVRAPKLVNVVPA